MSAKRICHNCRHWMPEVADAATGLAPADWKEPSYCRFHGTTTEHDDWCKHHSDYNGEYDE